MKYPVPFYKKKNDCIECGICPHRCILKEGGFGVCKVRKVEGGTLWAINYAEVTSAMVDPIEKKPLYHFMPGEKILSLGSFGCNMTCTFCQNYEISQHYPKTDSLSLEELCLTLKNIPDNIGVAFTYNEPFMWYEYVYDAAKKIKDQCPGKKVVIVTNGYIKEEPLLKLLPYIDAMNIDLKGYSNQYYRRICGANLDPVLETIRLVASTKIHVEITTLLVSDELDSFKEVEKIAQFIANINPDIPLHLSRYFPRYKLQNKATELDVLIGAQMIAKKYLNYVYIGNVADINQNTYCSHCNQLLVERNVYETKQDLKESICPGCQRKIPFVLK